MKFNDHSKFKGSHSPLSASNYHWRKDDKEAFINRLKNMESTAIGVALHDLAFDLIKHRIKLAKNDKKIVLLHLLKCGIPWYAIDINRIYDNFMVYVNDAIGFMLEPEVVLMYSENAFVTTDAISFRNNQLRIHDYKSGKSPASMEQLIIYAAYFCLEYKVDPKTIDTELRIYQLNEIIVHNPTPNDISATMEDIVFKEGIIQELKKGD